MANLLKITAASCAASLIPLLVLYRTSDFMALAVFLLLLAVHLTSLVMTLMLISCAWNAPRTALTRTDAFAFTRLALLICAVFTPLTLLLFAGLQGLLTLWADPAGSRGLTASGFIPAWVSADTLTTMVALVLLVLSAMFIRMSLAKRRNVGERLMEQFLERMRARGYTKARSEGLEEFVSRIEDGDVRSRAETFVAEFERVYYKDLPFTAQEISRLRRHLRAL